MDKKHLVKKQLIELISFLNLNVMITERIDPSRSMRRRRHALLPQYLMAHISSVVSTRSNMFVACRLLQSQEEFLSRKFLPVPSHRSQMFEQYSREGRSLSCA